MADSNPDFEVRTRTTFTDFPWKLYYDGDPPLEQGKLQSTMSQRTASEGHSWPPRGDAKNRDIGGPFETECAEVIYQPSLVHLRHYEFWEGRYLNFVGYHGYPNDIPYLPTRPTDSELDALGTTAIARVDPTKSVASASVFLGELLREGIPSLVGAQTWKNRSEKARSAGSEYLNVQFGWVPLVSEIRNMAHAVKDAEGILKQYERDAGRLVRRKYEFPIEKEVTDSYGDTGYGIPLTDYANSFGGARPVTTRESRETRQWFSGAFTYWIPTDDKLYGELRKYITYADKLLGLELTPETLWNLAPWSWAIDWFANVGDVLHNVSAFDPDRLVMKYGYIMSQQKVSKHSSWGRANFSSGESPGGYWRYQWHRKIRRPATPYGFGLNLGGLSDYQWSILAALGMTKGPRSL